LLPPPVIETAEFSEDAEERDAEVRRGFAEVHRGDPLRGDKYAAAREHRRRNRVRFDRRALCAPL
jgi:hypothetical protein